MRRMVVLVGVLGMLGVLGVGVHAPPAAAAGPRVTLFGDSVAAALTYSAEGRAAITSAYDLALDAEVCRRLVAPSCAYNGVTPSTALQAIVARSGQLGRTVVMDVGYNDLANRYSGDLDTVMQALVARGVERVIWLTLRAEGDFAATYVKTNPVIRAAPARWPQLTVADWDTYSAGKPWFARNAHLNSAGAVALGQYVRAQLDAVAPPPPPPPGGDRCDPSSVVGSPSLPPAILPADPAPAARVVPVTPVRVADTRPGAPDDGLVRPLGANRVLSVAMAGQLGVPSNATAVVVNVTAVLPCADGYLTVHPGGLASQPLSSTSNVVAGDVVASLTTVRLGTNGGISVESSVQTDVIVDLVGYLMPSTGSLLTTVAPFRLYDSRPAAIASGAEIELPIRGQGAVPATSDVVGAVVNLTVTEPAGAGFLTVYPGPCDPARRPLASSINYTAGRTIANLVVSSLGSSGSLCVYVSAQAKVIVDVAGWLSSAGAQVTTTMPQRLVDTRPGTGSLEPAFHQRLQPGVPVALPPAALAGVPGGATTLVANVTVVSPDAPGFLTAYPCAAGAPVASNVNYRAREVRPNLVVVRRDVAGQVCLVSFAGTDVIVDVVGWA